MSGNAAGRCDFLPGGPCSTLGGRKIISSPSANFFFFLFSLSALLPTFTASLVFRPIRFKIVIPQAGTRGLSSLWVRERRRPLVKSDRERWEMAWGMSKSKVKTSTGKLTFIHLRCVPHVFSSIR